MNEEDQALLSRLDERVTALARELRLAVIELRRESRGAEMRSQRALRLAAREIARRLRDLNGEASRIKTLHATTVSIEKFDGKMSEVFRRIDLLEGAAREGVGRESGADRTRKSFGTAWAILAGAISLAIGLYATFHRG